MSERAGTSQVMHPESFQRKVLVHVSDLHFHRPSYQPLQYVNKRFLGALNWWLRRRRQFPLARQRALVDYLQTLSWDYLLCSGDLTQLCLPQEFQLAHRILLPLLKAGPQQVFVLPGNHDRYVSEPSPGQFESFFGKYAPSQENSGVLWRRLSQYWWLLGWDSALPASWFCANGLVHSHTLHESSRLLASIPAKGRVILANHYPLFFPPPHCYQPRRDLRNHKELRYWLLQHSPPIALYLHGHIHHNWQWSPPEAKGSLTVVNSASSTQLPRTKQQSAFHRIVLEGNQYKIEAMKLSG